MVDNARISQMRRTMTATATDPTLPRLQVIEQLITAGKLAEAGQQLDDVARLAPNDPRVHLLGAHLAEWAGEVADAIYHTRRAVSLSPHWAFPRVELALLLNRHQQPQAGLEAAEQAVALAPQDANVLFRMSEVARQALQPRVALNWLERAAILQPENPDIRRMMARDLVQLGAHPEAMQTFDWLLSRDPNDAEARLGRLKLALELGDREFAQSDAVTLTSRHPDDPIYRFWHQVAHGELPTEHPAAMTRALFDSYAPVFDQHLVEGLQYRVPERVAALVAERYPHGTLDLLDLGCGTGLLARHLNRGAGRWTGVDLSARMLQRAAELQRYNELHQADLLAFLKTTPAQHHDVVAACDVFIYAGDLTQVVPEVARVLKPGGHFVVSCEAAQDGEPDLLMRPSHRYAHRVSHVQDLCVAAGLGDLRVEDTTIRVEEGQAIAGYILSARKNG